MAELGVYEALSTLRAVRRLKPDPIPDDVLRRVLEAASWAPTGGNRQPWRVVVVKDAAKKAQLGALYAQQWVPFAQRYRAALPDNTPADARGRLEKMIGAGDYLAQHFGESPAVLIFCFDPNEMAITDAGLDRPSVVGGGSVYPAVQNALIACRAEGLGCVLTSLLRFAEAEVRRLLNIPDPWATCAAVPIGYPLLRGHGPIRRRPIRELAFLDSFGTPLA
jgi:nitroreductase